MQLLFLGTGGSWPSKTRNVMAIVLRIGREVLLFDCGEGTQRQFMQTNVSFMKVTKVFITHYHGDHFLGLPGLIQSMSLNDREKPLHIFGPKGTSQVCRTLLRLGYFSAAFDVYAKDLSDHARLHENGYDVKTIGVDHDGIPALAYSIEEHERLGRFNKQKALDLGIPEGPLFGKLQRGQTIKVGNKTITPDMVLGKPRKGRKIVYTGDTKPCKTIEDLAEDCDVLIHDATLDSSLENKAHKYGHSTARDAAEIAKAANAKMLILVHISPRYKDTEVLESDAKSIFENTIVASDFLEYTLGTSD